MLALEVHACDLLCFEGKKPELLLADSDGRGGYVGLVIPEDGRSHLSESSSSPEEVVETLVDLGYCCFHIKSKAPLCRPYENRGGLVRQGSLETLSIPATGDVQAI